MTDLAYLKGLRHPTATDPLRLLTSACLIGTLCGANGSSYGDYPHIAKLHQYANVKLTSFCPEHFVLGTPREIPDIAGGTGADVLDGKAKVLTQSGRDVTAPLIAAAEKMLEIARQHHIELAIMMDVSGACGSQVIYKAHRLLPNPTYQIGMGVCAALLHRNGFKIISQRDYRSLEILMSKIDPQHRINASAIDHDETDWYKNYFAQ